MDDPTRSAAWPKPVGKPSTRRAVWLAVVLAGLVLRAPLAASQGPRIPPSFPLPPGAYIRIADAARDSTLPPWQRAIMLGGGHVGSTPDGESVPPVSSGVPEKATNANGRWVAGPRLL